MHWSKWIRTILPNVGGDQKKWKVPLYVGTVVDGTSLAQAQFSSELAEALEELQPGTVIKMVHVPQYFKESEDPNCPWKM